MAVNFEQVHNYYERLVFEEVLHRSANYTNYTAEMLADVACVALNRMPVRYVRHEVDLVFYLTEQERHSIELAMEAALNYAFQYVGEWTLKRNLPPAAA
jgi:AmiR/NasT family two-component response regulator